MDEKSTSSQQQQSKEVRKDAIGSTSGEARKATKKPEAKDQDAAARTNTDVFKANAPSPRQKGISPPRNIRQSTTEEDEFEEDSLLEEDEWSKEFGADNPIPEATFARISQRAYLLGSSQPINNARLNAIREQSQLKPFMTEPGEPGDGGVDFEEGGSAGARRQ
ncbi:Enhancer of polycomb-like protein 1 [Cladophialophora chaetospira]|uniref:Enhancer of polycomb-like protein 1 n=1 Tax=Cladophialophora chaetospira TaxID=386627 RepID=A0AA38X313_9EURO|nr:Enhancer of polycomb-like protein 1 [Cladophialophora chaetospira]